MATLEKIRSKSVLLLIIIGGALLAFIIGDFFTSGRTLFGSPTTVAKIDGQSIEIDAFQNRVQQMSNQLQQNGQKMDGAVIQQQVLSQMVQEALFNKEAENLGLTVTDSELADALFGANSQYADMYVQQMTGGQLQSAAQLNEIVSGSDQYANVDPEMMSNLSALWKGIEENWAQMLLQQKFNNLFLGTLQANDLDAKHSWIDNTDNRNVAFVSKSYSSLADDDYPISDDDIRNQWAKNKESYRLDEPTRAISYIAVAINPSQDDLAAAETQVEDALVALRNQPGTEGIAEMTDFVVDRQTGALSRMANRQAKAFADTASIGSVAPISHIGNNYTLAKLIDKKTAVDSVNINVAAVMAPRQQLDSIINGLNNGSVTFESLAQIPNTQSQTDLWLTLTDPQYSEIAEIINSAPLNNYFTPDTAASAQMGRIFCVNERKAPVATADVAIVTYTAEPSRATINKVNADLRAYIAENNDATKFAENAVAAGYTAVPTLITESTPTVGNYDDTRNAIVWALDAKKGQVSPVYGDEMSGQFIAVALNDIYDGYLPYNAAQIEPALRAAALNEKKGNALVEQYAGKASDLAGYAQLLGSQIDSTSVAFGQNSITRIGNRESQVTGSVIAAKPGTLVGPVKGTNSIVVLQVLNVDQAARPYNPEESASTFMRQRGGSALSQMIPAILMGNKKVDNRLKKFYRD
ncbi:MAG: SurA N-terminal domain-containing protein [Pseudoflavonifractor sp.]|nr:SurA N-terminal domain-containing protein [Alloprevotella sp.]MCM1116482.1 SurA N-terminal domain-containing protein [Pseudoflavonifractor sp.]